jgi:ferredoxin-type protein NapF
MVRLTRAQFLRGNWRGTPLSPSPDTVAKIDRTCLTRQGESCRTCDDLCELNAIRFTAVAGGLPVPEIIEDACTGCGDCLGVCPVDAIDLKERQPEEHP